ncbi:hypothetical protein TTHERM_00059110 (macronuclear) [Tetrahymena thermophila SB210]|uniref:Roadblock/LAMTOR2 domain-containing protein n=1 Tax=Tetrahymena thermophila (strain SB210) TaxID=312017 RepID=I7M0E1_TETTS|nr:hypothetical protein TTHERM_00059110 [Tetrahymena thermophila SB210]EAR87398.2 hypothetical protein TTHERM_00059110 [Tetrahymena thermophila SB210]|eukprot:XP_001007643.2 hypothetical protein TTHERM_00059110 [Tetrahymena thermophila SB210]
MEESITGTLIADPNGRVIKSSGELQNNQSAIVSTAIKMLEGTNSLIKNETNTFHKLNVTFDRYEYIITYDGNHIHIYLRQFE